MRPELWFIQFQLRGMEILVLCEDGLVIGSDYLIGKKDSPHLEGLSRMWGDVRETDMTGRSVAGWGLWMGWVLRLVETGIDGPARVFDVIDLKPTGSLGDRVAWRRMGSARLPSRLDVTKCGRTAGVQTRACG
jgi:hypothetical protein